MATSSPPPTFSAMEAVVGGDSPRRSGDSCALSASASSPEFEFWKFRNFSFSEHHLSPADELFVDGVLLPFKPQTPAPDAPPKTEPQAEADPAAESEVAPSASKRWKDIFRLGGEEKKKEKEKKKQHKERRGGGGPGPGQGPGAADLNINIWPFSRSRSAGTGGAPRPKAAAASSLRKASSAPCSRSNSGGESKSAARRLTPPSPARGVHVGRSSPVWRVRRRGAKAKDPGSAPGAAAATTAASAATTGSRVRVLNLSVPLCMGYRQQRSCRSDNVGAGGATAAAGGENANGNGGGLFKTLFSRKVH